MQFQLHKTGNEQLFDDEKVEFQLNFVEIDCTKLEMNGLPMMNMLSFSSNWFKFIARYGNA